MLVSREELEEAFTKVIEGKESFRSLEAKLHIPKSTLHRYYLSWLSKRVEELESRYRSLEGEMKEGLLLKDERDRLKSEIESLRRTKEALVAQVEMLRKEKEELKFLINGLIGYRSWLQNEVGQLLAEVNVLRTQKEGLKQSVQAWTQYKKKLEESA